MLDLSHPFEVGAFQEGISKMLRKQCLKSVAVVIKHSLIDLLCSSKYHPEMCITLFVLQRPVIDYQINLCDEGVRARINRQRNNTKTVVYLRSYAQRIISSKMHFVSKSVRQKMLRTYR